MRAISWAAGEMLIVLLWVCSASADRVVLLVGPAPPDGLVVAPVDLTRAIHHCGLKSVSAAGIAAETAEGAAVPMQFVPDVDFDRQARFSGTVVMQLPDPRTRRVYLRFGAEKPAEKTSWDGTVRTPALETKHDASQQGGFPCPLKFTGTGKTLTVHRWADRVYHRKLGSFFLANDPSPTVERVAAGPLCTVVRVRARYMQPGGRQPPGKPQAVYHWFYFHDRPLVVVRARATQSEPFAWDEHHFLELQFDQEEMPEWAGGDPLERGRFANQSASHRLAPWALVSERKNAIGMFAAGSVFIYDAPNRQGNYIQARGNEAWRPWNDTEVEKAAVLWIGDAENPVDAVRSAAEKWATPAQLVATTADVRSRIEAVEAELEHLAAEERRTRWWQSAARQLERQGRFDEAVAATEGKRPDNWTTVMAGQLGIVLENHGRGVHLVLLEDVATGTPLVAGELLPLFAVVLRNVETKQEIRLAADAGWKSVQIEQPKADGAAKIVWQGPAGDGPSDLRVVAEVAPDAASSALRWELSVENTGTRWSVWRVIFPQLALSRLGSDTCLLYPQTSGIVALNPWRTGLEFRGRYPGGWTTMQFFASYEASGKTGLYVAVHDPWGSTKEISATGRPAERAVEVAFDHPAPDMGIAGNDFHLCGKAVWQLLRGDWFDAAGIYGRWVRNEAKWFPELSENGRADTPLWMRELPVWALGGGAPRQCVEAVERFAAFLHVPSGFHWYNWHQIPFDNDYPHYFPAKEGFAEGVERLQAAGVYLMPYINGRLWDTRDRGMDDFQFSTVALPAVSKNENGEPYTEMYGSKESDGSRVRLGAMCPTTELWQRTVREIVLRLFRECGVKGVYIDQVAAAAPTLCFDSSHGHPLGGGHWWTEGYWKLIGEIRRQKPADRMLTTECNGEPYIHCFDGYLTWHWQYDGQVPAFPAIYGGAIQMFGRSYGGGPTRDLALRMRAAQQLVFGEQLGWINPGVVAEKENAEFFRRLVQLRWRLRRYFYAGRMARPPRLAGEIPTVRADWQWHGTRWITTDAVLTGAWLLPHEHRLVLLAVNVSDEEIGGQVEYDPADHRLSGKRLRITPIDVPSGAAGKAFSSPPAVRLPVVFPPRSAMAWELSADR